jgi:hypothetical protein
VGEKIVGIGREKVVSPGWRRISLSVKTEFFPWAGKIAGNFKT